MWITLMALSAQARIIPLWILKNPSKDDRKTPGNGSLHNTQQRLDVSLGYKGELSENSKLDIKAFYHLNRINYEILLQD